MVLRFTESKDEEGEEEAERFLGADWIHARHEAARSVRGDAAPGDFELHAAVGQEYRDGGDGRAAGLGSAGEPLTGAEPEFAAERRVHAQGEELCAPAGREGEGRWHERKLTAAEERKPDCGAAGAGRDDSRVFVGRADADRRGGAGAGRTVQIGTPDAGSDQRRPVADEHSVGQAGIFLRSVGQWRRGMDAGAGAGDGVRTDQSGVPEWGAAFDGRAVVPAGVPVRIFGYRGFGVPDRRHTGGDRL